MYVVSDETVTSHTNECEVCENANGVYQSFRYHKNLTDTQMYTRILRKTYLAVS